MDQIRDAPIGADGFKYYTPQLLAIYDALVLGFTNRLIWRCRSEHIVALYDRHVSDRHLDVGPGTGYFLDRCRFPSRAPRLTLFDANRNCLDHAGARLKRYAPETRLGNLLEPLPFARGAFRSVGISMVLHCIPATMSQKADIISRLAEATEPGGTVFGCTVLHGGVKQNLISARLMRKYNDMGSFSNLNDDAAGLTAALRSCLDDVELKIKGCVALFRGRAPERK
jgi:hypothetical protein